jgi:hypothetical protein
MSDTGRALPPAEHHVVVAWYDSPEQLAWTLKHGIANVRLGKRDGTWHIPPEMSSAVHVLLRTHDYKLWLPASSNSRRPATRSIRRMT